jgi:hypothetical protein
MFFSMTIKAIAKSRRTQRRKAKRERAILDLNITFIYFSVFLHHGRILI